MVGAPMSVAASLEDVSLRWGRQWALARVSVELPRGGVTVLTGPNGAGKTTLLRVLGTALPPTFGVLRLFGEPATPPKDGQRRRLGLFTHKSYLYDDLSARENLVVVARLGGAPLARIPALLERVGLAAHADRQVRVFSAGMQRRLGLARLLLREPELALLDEPFGQLDPEGVALMEEVVRELAQAGVTVVLSTHDLERGERLGRYHLRLEDGRVSGDLRGRPA
jgi:heme exporter protein A